MAQDHVAVAQISFSPLAEADASRLSALASLVRPYSERHIQGTANMTDQLALSRRLLLGAGVIAAAGCSAQTAKTGAAKTSSPAAPARAADVRTGYADVDGLKVYYEVHGGAPDGPTAPFVLLHGGMMAIETAFADDLLPRLAKIRPVIAIEQQGHGHTADREGPITLDRVLADTSGVLKHLGVARAHFVGHSFGGMIALGMAVSYPDQVASITPISAMRTLDGFLPELVIMQRDPTHAPSAALMPLLPTEADFAAWQAHYQRHNPNPAGCRRCSAR
jgi:hypothetical protein